MPGSTLFYAFIVNIHNHDWYRVVVVFASRYVADEWWRAISSITNDKVAGSFQRVTPQFYTHNSSKATLCEFFDDEIFKDIAPKFRGKVLFTYENGREGAGKTRGIRCIPEQEVVDHRNGKLFYIRSRHDSNLYWNYAYSPQYLGGEVSVSTAPTRSRFRIIAADTSLVKGTVLIGSDKVIIQIAKDLYVTVSDSNELVSSNEPYEFPFSDLVGGKFASPDETILMYSAEQSDDEWELA